MQTKHTPSILRTAETQTHRASSAARSPNDRQSPDTSSIDMAAVIGWILQGGVILSSAIILLGVIMIPLRGGGLSGQIIQVFPHTLDQVWAGLLVFQPQAIIALGLVLLIATPVIRVAASVIAFALEHDRRYVIITFAVLVILIASFVLGKGGA
jgi:uncharacterized membrane protein